MNSVLTIQSHVVHGYVGNRAATITLQLRGWDVDTLNSVQYSNHTGYGKFTGSKTSPDDIAAIYGTLKEHDFKYDAYLNGYLPSAEAVRQVGEIGKDLRKRNPDIVWLLDPVMGDEGQLYVNPDMVPVYRDILLSGAVTLITPNAFEASTLTELPVDNFEDVRKVIDCLHEKFKVPHVVISSVVVDEKLYTIASSQGEQAVVFELDRIDSYFSGTGDFFAALTLDNFMRLKHEPNRLASAVASSLETVQNVLKSTVTKSISKGFKGKRGSTEAMKHLELRIIEHRKEIMEDMPQGHPFIALD
ncbi:Putative pyridoxal kinase BUD16 [Wickerhamiella sorbophila]|uniref:pyridoxal kinase n=1 Tax=Wickerhamiella sorbophila TaxID=45607 RepID=A0A2T0FLI8_9ASCO|nr:Putative pyridoxal kinase BUD16 [Wickerhamiella sorbophila]PRT55842.1 Putative pyridoxal kinase BUD16 [Wickerhamiella sorbophila]